eukprot:COSAG06_NODE_2372_length_6990_cov_6.727906_6_plen_96_part_00
MTRKLYQIVKEHQVTYITIAHRPALKAYHERMLSIGDGKQVRPTTHTRTNRTQSHRLFPIPHQFLKHLLIYRAWLQTAIGMKRKVLCMTTVFLLC